MCKAIEELKKDWYAEGMENGMEKGMEKGLEKGMEKGIEKGMEKGLESMVRVLKGVYGNINDIFERITKDANYRDVTLEMVKRYY